MPPFFQGTWLYVIGPFPSGPLPLPLFCCHRLLTDLCRFFLLFFFCLLARLGLCSAGRQEVVCRRGDGAVPAFPWNDLNPLPAVIPWQQARISDILGRWPNIGGWGDADATYQWIFLIKLRKSSLHAVGASSFLQSQEYIAESCIGEKNFSPSFFVSFKTG